MTLISLSPKLKPSDLFLLLECSWKEIGFRFNFKKASPDTRGKTFLIVLQVKHDKCLSQLKNTFKLHKRGCS